MSISQERFASEIRKVEFIRRNAPRGWEVEPEKWGVKPDVDDTPERFEEGCRINRIVLDFLGKIGVEVPSDLRSS